MKAVLIFLIAFSAITTVASKHDFSLKQLDEALRQLNIEPEVLISKLQEAKNFREERSERKLCGCGCRRQGGCPNCSRQGGCPFANRQQNAGNWTPVQGSQWTPVKRSCGCGCGGGCGCGCRRRQPVQNQQWTPVRSLCGCGCRRQGGCPNCSRQGGCPFANRQQNAGNWTPVQGSQWTPVQGSQWTPVKRSCGCGCGCGCRRRQQAQPVRNLQQRSWRTYRRWNNNSNQNNNSQQQWNNQRWNNNTPSPAPAPQAPAPQAPAPQAPKPAPPAPQQNNQGGDSGASGPASESDYSAVFQGN